MGKNQRVGFGVTVALAILGSAACSKAPAGSAIPSLATASMPCIGAVDERFQSYNVEMVEVIGGRFWKPYGDHATANSTGSAIGNPADGNPVGMDPDIYQQRPPIDLSNPRLRKLAAALGPAYMRVSGT